MAAGIKVMEPQWPAPAHVRALTTERSGGHSVGTFSGMNLASHVGDDPQAVAANRALLCAAHSLPAAPHWLAQVHGPLVVQAGESGERPAADGIFTTTTGVVCAVLTADCAPVFLTDRTGTFAAVLHVGWRGLAAGIIEAGLATVPADTSDLLAWVGPGIGPGAFVVGGEVRKQLLNDYPEDHALFVTTGARYLANLPGLVLAHLQRQKVGYVAVCPVCTYSDSARWFSHRRESPCGRMASLIWLEAAVSGPVQR